MSELNCAVLFDLVLAALWLFLGIRDLMGKDPLFPFNKKYSDPEYRAMWQKKNGVWEIVNGIAFGAHTLLTAYFSQLLLLREILLFGLLLVDIIYFVAFQSWDHSDD